MSRQKSMTKAEIVDHLAKKVGTTKKQANEFLDTFVKLTYKQAANDFIIPGLGKISVGKRKARMGRNPQTGETIKIPAAKVLKFTFAKSAKDVVRKSSFDNIEEMAPKKNPKKK